MKRRRALCHWLLKQINNPIQLKYEKCDYTGYYWSFTCTRGSRCWKKGKSNRRSLLNYYVPCHYCCRGLRSHKFQKENVVEQPTREGTIALQNRYSPYIFVVFPSCGCCSLVEKDLRKVHSEFIETTIKPFSNKRCQKNSKQIIIDPSPRYQHAAQPRRESAAKCAPTQSIPPFSVLT